MASISFTDAIGAATLENGKPGYGSRFTNWLPQTLPVGEAVPRASDGRLTVATWRTQYGASFEIPMIPVKETGGVSPVTIADRLAEHLLGGGVCTVTTDDVNSAEYEDCFLMPGTTPSLTLTNERQLEYTFAVSLVGTARMICVYDG